METTAAALFLCLRAARNIITGLVSAGIIGQATLLLFDQVVQALKIDCVNGGVDLTIAHQEVAQAFNPAEEQAKPDLLD